MKSLIVASVLLSLFSLSPDVAPADINDVSRERIQKLVVEPLQQRAMFWRPSAFSRAVIVVEPPELRLWTSHPVTDANDRGFVRFRVEDVENERTAFTGCYYPATDDAFVVLEGVEAPVPIDEHPWLTLRAPDQARDGGRCRAKD